MNEHKCACARCDVDSKFITCVHAYFLEKTHKSVISVGYDVNLVTPVIIVTKKTGGFKILEFSILLKIYEFCIEINKYFNGGKSSPTNIQCKELVLIAAEQKWLIIRDCVGRISLNGEEWNSLHKLLPVLITATSDERRTVYLVTDYYEFYLKQCISQNVLKVEWTLQTPYQIDLNTLNYSRLFFTSPILSLSRSYIHRSKDVSWSCWHWKSVHYKLTRILAVQESFGLLQK